MTGTLALVRERQSAVSADFRRYYGTSLRDAARTWTAQEMTAAVRHLPLDSALARDVQGDLHGWDYVAANVAELVDLMHFWLHQEYAQWVYDPDDPENKNAPKVKPPKQPLIPPIAYRPESVMTRLVEDYTEKALVLSPQSKKRVVSSDEFDSIIDAL